MPSLWRLRQLAGLTQQELAAAAGVSKQTVVQLEGGKRAARPPTMRRIAAALGTTIAHVDEFTEALDRRRRGRPGGG